MQFGLPRGFHLESIVEAIEVIEQAGDGGDFDDLAFGEVLPGLGEQFVGDVIGIESEDLGKFEGGMLAWAEAIAVAGLERPQFLFGRPEPPCQGGM